MAEAEPSAPVEASAPAPAKPLLKKLKVGGTLAGIVLVQCLVVYLWLPAGEERTANASVKVEPVAAEAAHHAPSHEQSEVDLGAFSLTVYNPNNNSNLLVDFHLFGTVSGPAAEEAQRRPTRRPKRPMPRSWRTCSRSKRTASATK